MLYPIVAVVNFLICCGKYAINGLASQQDGTLFVNKTGDISDAYYVEITPAGWTFSIWGIIYTLEVLWLVYSLTLICRKVSPAPIPTIVPAINILGSFLNVAWLICFDRQEIVAAMILLICYSLVFYSMIVLSYISLNRASPGLVEKGQTKDIWLTRAFLQNGLAMQATWVSVATLLNVAMVMQYKSDPAVDVTDAATVALSILTVEIIVFAITDLGFLDRFSRYTFTPYIVLVWALSGSYSKNYVEGARNSVFTVVLLSFAAVLLLVKIIVSIVRHVKGRSYTTTYDSTVGGSSKGNLA